MYIMRNSPGEIVMLRNVINRSLGSIRTFSATRVPGRIFGNYEQQQSNQQDSQNFESPATVEGGRRFNNSQPQLQNQSFDSPASSNTASVAFTEEALQDYSLMAFKDASSTAFSSEIVDILSEPIDEQLIEIKPDGSCYLPEVHYRRILNKAFGIGGWSLIPRGAHSIQANVISREYALFVNGRFISQARGHSTITGSFQNPALCTESVRSNSLMRCCKDLGIASSLWDNGITSQWKAKYAVRKSVTDYQGRTKYIWEKKRSEQY